MSVSFCVVNQLSSNLTLTRSVDTGRKLNVLDVVWTSYLRSVYVVNLWRVTSRCSTSKVDTQNRAKENTREIKIFLGESPLFESASGEFSSKAIQIQWSSTCSVQLKLIPFQSICIWKNSSQANFQSENSNLVNFSC